MLECLSQETALRQYGQAMWAEGRLEAVLALLKNGIITEEQAASGAGMTVDAFRKAVAALETASVGELPV